MAELARKTPRESRDEPTFIAHDKCVAASARLQLILNTRGASNHTPCNYRGYFRRLHYEVDAYDFGTAALDTRRGASKCQTQRSCSTPPIPLPPGGLLQAVNPVAYQLDSGNDPFLLVGWKTGTVPMGVSLDNVTVCVGGDVTQLTAKRSALTAVRSKLW